MLQQGRSERGGFTKEQALAVGVPWPLVKGWLQSLIGAEIEEEAYQKFLASRRTTYKKARKDNAAKRERKRQRKVVFPGKHGPVHTVYAAKKPAIHPHSTDAFLASYEWRRVRMQVLKRDGARCACCGSTPADGVKMNVDHIKPRKLYPQLALDLSNLQVLCEVCNHGKGNWDMTDWRTDERSAIRTS
jgi:hypothetical protein